MTQEPSTLETIVDRAMADAGPAIPAAPQIRTSSSMAHLLLGNGAYLLLIAAGITDMLSWWIVVLLGLAAGIFAISSDPSESIKKEFRDARFGEIRPMFASDAEAQARVEQDLQGSVHTAPIVNWIAIPAFLLSFLVLVGVFVDVNESRGGWFWLLRWGVAAAAALAAWTTILFLWAASNLTPAQQRIDYMERKSEEENATRFGDHDRNDFHIVRQTVNLESLHRRIDTYTLESALLSALSFSSFMAIILSERDYDEALARLIATSVPWRSLDGPIPLLDVTGYPTITAQYLHANLVPLISLMLLLCASTFLGVLVGRLRFNDGYRDAESLLKVAERINEKEEKALEDDKVEKAALYIRPSRIALTTK